jgi:MFS family permease
VFHTYRDVLSLPGARGFSAAGALARLPMSMLGIGIVLLVESATGSYATAGAVAGVFGLTSAVASPWVSRAVDRFGQAAVMLPAVGLHLGGLILLLVCTQFGAPRWTVFGAAVLAGASIGSIGALVRARWSYALTGHERETALLHTAYSLESVIDEVVFISGPLLVTTLATGLAPIYGVIAAGIAVGVGGTLLMLQRGTEPPPSGLHQARGGGVLRAPGMVVLCLAMICVGVIFGSMEVLAIAFADERRHLDRAGWVLAGFALGSLLAGLGYGAVQWRTAAGPRFRSGVVLLAVGVAPVLFVQNLLQLAIVVFIAGFAISPMLISGFALVQELVDPARLTEGLTWTGSGIGIGVSLGAAVAGAVVDAVGAGRGFTVPVSAGLLAAVLVMLCSRWLRPTPAPVGAEPEPGSPDRPN